MNRIGKKIIAWKSFSNCKFSNGVLLESESLSLFISQMFYDPISIIASEIIDCVCFICFTSFFLFPFFPHLTCHLLASASCADTPISKPRDRAPNPLSAHPTSTKDRRRLNIHKSTNNSANYWNISNDLPQHPTDDHI